MEDEEFLKSRGWYTWYNYNYWVHEKTVKDPSRQDCTYYGFTKEDAVKYEKGEINAGKPFNGALFNARW